jgi:exodeoxyribonuclease VII large subunit
MDHTIPPLGVSEYINYLNSSLKGSRKRVIGEVFELLYADSGHVYFTLKDKKEDAVLKCAIWRSNYQIQGIQLKNGMEVIATGFPEIYPIKGRLSFIISSIELVGEGQLKAAYDDLKRSLTKEGLFATENKRALPIFPKKIGIITSRSGAVIHDFLGNVDKCGFNFIFCDSRVEGKDALKEILQSLKTMRAQNIDALVIMRGGGPMQSLAAFDNEILVREIAKFPVPVIAAIGHHLDIPLAALAADIHVSTPTAAANLIGKSWEDGRFKLRKLSQEVIIGYSQLLQDSELTLQLRKETVLEAFRSLSLIFDQIRQQIKDHLVQVHATIPGLVERINNLTEYILVGFHSHIVSVYSKLVFSDEISALAYAISHTQDTLTSVWEERIVRPYNYSFQSAHKELAYVDKTIHLRDPRVLLKHGYSILQKNGKVVKSVKNVTIGELVEVTLSDGQITSQVKELKKYE